MKNCVVGCWHGYLSGARCCRSRRSCYCCSLFLLSFYLVLLSCHIHFTTSLLPVCSLLLADCDDTRCAATSRQLLFFLRYLLFRHLRHISRRHVWAGHLLDTDRSAAHAAPNLSLYRLSPSVTGYVRWASGHRAAQCGHVTVTLG